MAMTYAAAVSAGFPTVEFTVTGDPAIYENLDWTGGDSIPSRDDLDAWIKLNSLTKYQFRQLFTMAERVAIDNAQLNPSITDDNKAILFTMTKDLDLAESIELSNAHTIQGIQFLVAVGLLAAPRAAQILAGIPA
jgi:hypothetical protein